MTEVLERFLKYVKIDTASSEDAVDVFPSTKKQFDLGRLLVEELKEIGIEAELDEKYGYVYASIPSNADEELKSVGFIAHMDTSPAISGTDVKPRIIENYDGEEHVNIGTGEEISIRELAETIKGIVGFEGNINFNTDMPDGTMRKVTDVTKLHSLGWHHRHSLEEGIKLAYNAFLEERKTSLRER